MAAVMYLGKESTEMTVSFPGTMAKWRGDERGNRYQPCQDPLLASGGHCKERRTKLFSQTATININYSYNLN